MNGLVLLLALGAAPWVHKETKDEIMLYQRDVEGERVVELKLTTISKLPIDALCAAAYGPDALDKDEPEVTVRQLISRSASERITYEQVTAPVVSNRDYAVRAVKESLPGGGCRTRFEAANQHAPKVPDGFVRIEKLRGGFTFEPLGENVLCTYTIFTDPGGSLPALLIEGTRKKTAFRWVRLVLTRAAAAAQQRPN